jgi:single-strand DNA-binding protein
MNKVMLLGRLTRDIELKHSNSGTAYASFNLAVNRKFKQEGQQDTDFISCKAFGKTAEFMAKYMGKGRQVAIEGRIQTGSYEREGTKVYTTDVIVDQAYFADSRQTAQDQNGQAALNEIEETDGFVPVDEDDTLPF